MNKQTIDGVLVSRELLERVLGWLEFNKHYRVDDQKELRALLDAHVQDVDTTSSTEGLRRLLVEIYNHHGTTTDHCDRIRLFLSQTEHTFEVETLTEGQIEAIRTASTATNIPREHFSKGLFKNE